MSFEKSQKYIDAFNKMPIMLAQKSQILIEEAEKWGQHFYQAGQRSMDKWVRHKGYCRKVTWTNLKLNEPIEDVDCTCGLEKALKKGD